MPSYGEVAGVHALYPRIGSVTAVTSSIVTTFLNHAESKVHAAIAGRYRVPITGNPPLLKYTAETLAMAMILRRFFSQEQENQSEWVNGLFEEVKEILTGLANGAMTLVDSGNAVVMARGVSYEVWSNTKKYAPTMSLLDPVRQEIDPDRVSDIEESMA